MLTRIQHFAIVSENFVREAKFYESAFGMKRSKPGSEEEQKAIRTNYAVSISDGYVGVTVIGRKPGYIPGLHHFGVDVSERYHPGDAQIFRRRALFDLVESQLARQATGLEFHSVAIEFPTHGE